MLEAAGLLVIAARPTRFAGDLTGHRRELRLREAVFGFVEDNLEQLDFSREEGRAEGEEKHRHVLGGWVLFHDVVLVASRQVLNERVTLEQEEAVVPELFDPREESRLQDAEVDDASDLIETRGASCVEEDDVVVAVQVLALALVLVDTVPSTEL
jgi:hypothetical protein